MDCKDFNKSSLFMAIFMSLPVYINRIIYILLLLLRVRTPVDNYFLYNIINGLF
jgi:hypothetical protein